MAARSSGLGAEAPCVSSTSTSLGVYRQIVRCNSSEYWKAVFDERFLWRAEKGEPQKCRPQSLTPEFSR